MPKTHKRSFEQFPGGIKMKTTKIRLGVGVATVALATAIGSPAQAACTVDGATVTCTADSTAAEVNAAMASVAGGNVTLNVAANANVTQPGSPILPSQQGAVAINNAGDVGVPAARVDVLYVGTSTAATNTFSLANTDTISGAVNVFSVGGATTINNSGLIGNGLVVSTSGTGPVSVTNSGLIDADGSTGIEVRTRGDATVVLEGDVGTVATATDASDLKDVFVAAQQLVNLTPTTTVTTEGTATTTRTVNAPSSFTRVGGAADVTLAQGASSGAVTVVGLEAAAATVNGAVGSATDYQNVFVSSNALEQNETRQSTTDGADFNFENTSVSRRLGGTADATVGAAGSVSGNVSADGLAAGTVTVDGTIGSAAATGGAFANSSGIDRTTVQSGSRVGAVTTSATVQNTTSVGGIATVNVGESGVVTGGVNANGVGGAAVEIDGAVGLANASSFANANSSGRTTVVDQRSTNDAATGANTFDRDDENRAIGGNASVTVGADGVVNGGVSVFADGDAAVTNAGMISGSSFASARATDFASSQTFASDGTGNFSNGQTNTSTSSGGAAAISNAAGGMIGSSATSPVNVTATGDASASVTNAGRINGNISASAGGQTTGTTNVNATSVSTDTTTLVETRTVANDFADTRTNKGGDANFGNAATGLVTGSVNVFANGDAVVTNDGAVIGSTLVQTSFDDTVNRSSRVVETVTVPGVAGGVTTTDTSANSFTRTSTGGDITGTYAGSNGAVQFAPFGGPSDGTVSQFADGDSTALVTGAIFGNFTGNAAGETITDNTVDQSVTVVDADGDLRSIDGSFARDFTDRQSDSSSTLAVNGGTITGNASLFATGAASAQLGNDATIGGNLSVTAQSYAGRDFSEDEEFSAQFDEDGLFVRGTSETVRETRRYVNAGNVSATVGEATVAGSVSLNGAAGTNTFTLARDGAVGGSVFQSNAGSTFASEETRSSVFLPTRTTETIGYAEASNAAGGNVTANVAGTVGLGLGEPLEYGDVFSAGGNSLSLFTNAGAASATLSGQVRNGVSVRASGANSTFAYQQTLVDGLTRAYSEQRSSTATGGSASLTVAASDRDVPANFGDIIVAGRGGSSVTIGANSSVLAATGGAFMQVGGTYFDTTSTREDTYTGAVRTGEVLTFTANAVGGASTLLNNGRIGYDGGAAFNGNTAAVFVTSPTAATATNNGEIYGSIDVRSLSQNFASRTTRTNINDVTRVDTTDRTYTPIGGTATFTNSGLVTGDVGMAARTGTVTNGGVVRGDLNLGGSVDNYTTRSVDTLTQIGEEDVLTLGAAFEQLYTVDQNGLLGGVITVGGAFGFIDDEVQTSNIVARINLNNGSISAGGVVAEYDDQTGERFTATTVNLNGAGYLGLGEIALDALEDAFGNVDPQIARAGDLAAYAGGARVLGVEALNKTGNGVFLITGADFVPVGNTNRFADYTLDIGTFTIAGGEVQLDTATDEGVFGIRGNVVNNAGLVLGSRVALPAPLFGTNASITAIDGVEVYQSGNFTQSGTGTLTVGITPTLVRVADPAFSSVSLSSNPLAVQQIGLASGLFTTPDRAFGQAFADLGTGLLRLDGNLNLAGTVQLVSPTGGLFTDGQRVDIASVSGTVTENASVVVNGRSNFVTFDLATRSEGGRTIVFATADRAGFDTVATNQNAAAAGTALSAALPGVVSTIQAGSAGGIGLGGDQFVLAQDLANVFVAFDNLATSEQVADALNELASGEFYGSLTNLSTTAPFVDAITARRLPQGATGFNLWFAPSGDFIEHEGDEEVGSFDVDADNYGGAFGLGMATGNGELGVGFGYGRIDATSRGDLLHAEADTWMIGAYARQEFGPLALGAELVYGWSNWNASRVMPVMSRETEAEFDSTELRGTLHAEYTVDVGGGWIAPFGQLEFRKFDFDGFTEEGAGAVSLIVDEASDTVLSQRLGVRAGTSFETRMATLRPEMKVAYTFAGDGETFRDVAYLGAPGTEFRLQGIMPDDYLTIGAGLYADIGPRSGAFLRGEYTTGDNVKVGSVNAGVTIGF